MNNQIVERIKIAKGFKSTYNWKGKTPEKREKILKGFGFLNYGIAILLLCAIIVDSAITTFQIEIFSGKWTNAGLIVLMAMSLSLSAPFLYIELMLHNHIKKIENLKIEFDEKLNTEFGNIIKQLNIRKKYIYLIGLPAILIIIPAFLQVFDVNPYWDKFPPIVLVVSLYVLVVVNYGIIKLKRNLKRVESIN